MNFCPNCETYLTTKIASLDTESDPTKLLTYQCANCGYYEKVNPKDNPEKKCIISTNYDTKKMKLYQHNLQYLHLDPTLPRVDNIQCPNESCPTNRRDSGLTNDVLYLNLNEADLTYLYKCMICKFTWTNK